MQKLRLLCTEKTRGSQSLRSVAQLLSEKVGYKVWRSTKEHARRIHLRYGQSSNKLEQYRWFQQQGLSALEFTTDPATAAQWATEGHTVFGRRILNGSCGQGIVVIEPPTDPSQEWCLPSCPVYTKYKKKKREFRVHVFKNQVVAIKEKKRRKGFEGQRETKIRNLANGYVFCTAEQVPDGLKELALAASGAVSSDFKGVDVGYNERNNELFIIEVNSAPGIQGSNINAYVEAILK